MSVTFFFAAVTRMFRGGHAVDLVVSGAEEERRIPTQKIVGQVAATVQVSADIKLAPSFSSMSHMAAELVRRTRRCPSLRAIVAALTDDVPGKLVQ